MTDWRTSGVEVESPTVGSDDGPGSNSSPVTEDAPNSEDRSENRGIIEEHIREAADSTGGDPRAEDDPSGGPDDVPRPDTPANEGHPWIDESAREPSAPEPTAPDLPAPDVLDHSTPDLPGSASSFSSLPPFMSAGPERSAAAALVEPRAAPPVDGADTSAERHDPTGADGLPREPSPATAGLTAEEPSSAPGPRVRPLPRAIAVANQKGGVGKTTTAVNLGAALAELGYRVLLVDLDPQGNATTGLGVNPRNLTGSVYDVLMNDAPIEDCIEPTAMRNLFVVPATIDLAGAEIELVPAFSRELKLRRAIDSLGADFDFTLIDCPPSLGLLTVNGLAAAGEVLVPIQCEYYALEGLGQLIKNIQLVQSNLNPRLELSTIVLTMYDARTRLSDQVAKEVREHFGAKVCRSIVPRTVRLSEAPSFGQPINVFDPSSRGATAYRELAKEVSGGAARRSG